jgi:hypothetical protein
MSHLSPEDLIDIADGTRGAPPHLASCETCQRQLADIRNVMTSIADVGVPEPSPLFWDHFSARVSEAVAAEAVPRRRWLASWRLAAPAAALAAAAAVVLAVAVHRFKPSPAGDVTAAVQQASAPNQAESNSGAPSLADPSADPSFAFVADLTTDMDMDTAIEAGLVSDESADHAVTHLNDGELRALAQLLRAEIAKGQAS